MRLPLASFLRIQPNCLSAWYGSSPAPHSVLCRKPHPVQVRVTWYLRRSSCNVIPFSSVEGGRGGGGACSRCSSRGEGGGDHLRVGGGPPGGLGVGSLGVGSHTVFPSYSWYVFCVATDLVSSRHLDVL